MAPLASPSAVVETPVETPVQTLLPSPPGAPSAAKIARELAARPDLWRPLVRFTEPRHYARLAAGARWEAWVLSWLPDQGTGLHDHGGSAGAFVVLRGTLDEAVPESVPADGSESAVALRSRRFAAGELRRFGSDHVHDVVAAQGAAVSLHVYAPRLTAMTRYRLGGDGRLEVTALERAGRDW